MGLFNWDSPAHRLQNSQLSKTLVLQLCSEMLASGLVQEQRRELSLWSLEAQVCRCQLKKEAFSPYYHPYFCFLVAVSSWFLSV